MAPTGSVGSVGMGGMFHNSADPTGTVCITGVEGIPDFPDTAVSRAVTEGKHGCPAPPVVVFFLSRNSGSSLGGLAASVNDGKFICSGERAEVGCVRYIVHNVTLLFHHN